MSDESIEMDDADSAELRRSTKGASKHRRELINIEIDRLKDLLPLQDSVRARLFQLQVMSLACILIRRSTLGLPVTATSRSTLQTVQALPSLLHDLNDCVRAFCILLTRAGKLLHVSSNVQEYIGYLAEDMMSQGDNIYDIVDMRDHDRLRHGLHALDAEGGRVASVMVRLNLHRAAKRQPQYQKYISMELREVVTSQSRCQVVMASCTPLITPESCTMLSIGNPTVFTFALESNMRITMADSMAQHHTGYSEKELQSVPSWYVLMHVDDTAAVVKRHRALNEEREVASSVLFRLQTKTGYFVWVFCVLQAREHITTTSPISLSDATVHKYLIATCQLIDNHAAASLLSTNWLSAQSMKTIKTTTPLTAPSLSEAVAASAHESAELSYPKTIIRDATVRPWKPPKQTKPTWPSHVQQWLHKHVTLVQPGVDSNNNNKQQYLVAPPLPIIDPQDLECVLKTIEQEARGPHRVTQMTRTGYSPPSLSDDHSEADSLVLNSEEVPLADAATHQQVLLH